MKKESLFYKLAAANGLIIVLPVIIAFTLTVVLSLAKYADAGSPFFFLGIALMVVGWCLLLRSKWPQIRQGQIWTFGISESNSNMRHCYRLGYAMIILGWLVCTFSGYL